VSEFRIAPMSESTVFNLYLQREDIWLDPPYQRMPEVWTLDKKQLLIDSLLNGFDIPKFYLHDFFPNSDPETGEFRYAIVDGKQRLGAIWDFIDGNFALSDSIEIINEPDLDVKNLTYSELEKTHLKLKSRFDSRALSVMTIQTLDTELIEEMFSRLNEAMPLSAAEKRNALRGPLPKEIREIADHALFTDRLPFNNSRYRHYDVACKFLKILDSTDIPDLKKYYLDDFVRKYRDEGLTGEAQELSGEVKDVLDRMAADFTTRDPLLRQIGMVTLYFALYSGRFADEYEEGRQPLLRFEEARGENRSLAEEDVAQATYNLLEFDRLAQTPNDAVALQYRFDVMSEWLDEN